jgi:hypothetical protein
VTLTYGAASGNGATAGEVAYQYQVNGGAWIAMPGDKVIRSGVGNNGTYTIGVRASTTMDGVTYAGPATTSSAVAPYGAPIVPSLSAANGDTTVTFTLLMPARNGRDIHMMAQVDGGNWQWESSGGTFVVGDGHSQTHSMRAKTVDDLGRESAEVAASGTTAPAPPPPPTSWTVTVGGTETCPQNQFTTSNFHPGSPAKCVATGGFIPAWRGLTVVCSVNEPGWYDSTDPSKDTTWYRISGGNWSGEYVVRSNVSGDVTGMPGC